MNIKIKLAKPDDSGLLADIGAKTFFETYSGKVKKENLESYIKKLFNKEKILKELKDKNSIFLIAFKSEEAIGYAKLNKNKKVKGLQNRKSIELERIYILKKMIGKKIGKFLMEKCLEIAKKKNYQTIWLGVWEHNKLAISFYKKWYFDIFGYQKFRLGEEKHKDLLMKKELS